MRWLLFVLLSTGCAQLAPAKDDCDTARRIFAHCGVSLPLLEGQACLGVPRTIARCVIKVGNDCDQLAQISSRLYDCVASADESLPPIEDVPLVGHVDGGVDAAPGEDAALPGDASQVSDASVTPDMANVAWAGFTVDDALAAGEQRTKSTTVLQPGTYRFTMTGSGDADLYVRIGLAPTLNLYDCRPFLSGSNESCTVTLASSDKLYTLVRSQNVTSAYHLVAEPQ